MDGQCVKMCQPLPVRGFKWMTTLDNWRNIPCILVVDLEYPKEHHDLHNDYPLAPQRLMIKKVEKPNPNLNDKEKYYIHHKKPQTIFRPWFEDQRSYRGISFKEEP